MIRSTLKHLAILTVASFAIGCAPTSNSLNKVEMAAAAGFKAISPTNPGQTEALKKLPADKFTRATRKGKTYYVLPDRKDGQLYVGSPKQYEAYQEDVQARQAVKDNDDATSNRSVETGEENDNPNTSLLENWDWSDEDGQTF